MVRRAGKSPPGGAIQARPRARQQRPEQQHRAAQPADQGAVGLVRAHLPAADGQRRAADALDLGAEIEQQTRHHVDVHDARARWSARTSRG